MGSIILDTSRMQFTFQLDQLQMNLNQLKMNKYLKNKEKKLNQNLLKTLLEKMIQQKMIKVIWSKLRRLQEECQDSSVENERIEESLLEQFDHVTKRDEVWFEKHQVSTWIEEQTKHQINHLKTKGIELLPSFDCQMVKRFNQKSMKMKTKEFKLSKIQ